MAEKCLYPKSSTSYIPKQSLPPGMIWTPSQAGKSSSNGKSEWSGVVPGPPTSTFTPKRFNVAK
jgi:hypothetical protein